MQGANDCGVLPEVLLAKSVTTTRRSMCTLVNLQDDVNNISIHIVVTIYKKARPQLKSSKNHFLEPLPFLPLPFLLLLFLNNSKLSRFLLLSGFPVLLSLRSPLPLQLVVVARVVGTEPFAVVAPSSLDFQLPWPPFAAAEPLAWSNTDAVASGRPTWLTGSCRPR